MQRAPGLPGSRQASAIALFLCGAGYAVFFLPLRIRGDGAPGGAAVVGSRSASPCGNAEAPPGAPPEHVQCPGSFAAVFFRFAHSRKRNCCAGPRFPDAVLIEGFPIRGCLRVPTGYAVISDRLSGKDCGQASTAAPSASSWQAARIGHRAEPRRRPSAWEERSSPARGRRILLHHQTPHDDAPRLSRTHYE